MFPLREEELRAQGLPPNAEEGEGEGEELKLELPSLLEDKPTAKPLQHKGIG